MRTALFVGRFQPLHKGHLKVMKRILKENDRLIIVIGSTNEHHTERNPFTASERIEMIRLVLRKEKLKRYSFIKVPDYDSNDTWVRAVEKKAPAFQIVYSGIDLVQELFRRRGYPTITVPRYYHLHATTIRNKIIKRQPWRHLVHPLVIKWMKKHKAEERIIRIFKNRSS